MQNAIKLWIDQIQQKPICSLSLIKDAQYLHSILTILDPNFFKVEPNCSYDALVDLIVQYYRSILYLDVTNSLASARKDQDNLKMWVIVLGIAIRCEERNLYIQLILNMDEKTQSSLMGFISKIDDTLATCPALDMEVSGMKKDKENVNLEKHLLNTIDELSEENATIKNRIQDLEDELSTVKANKDTMIESLQKQISQFNAQKEEILGDYQGVYKTDNLAIIFKAIVSENSLFKEIIEKQQGVTEKAELEKDEMTKQMEKMLEQNKILKVSIIELENLQAKIEEQQQQIASLRKNENELLNKVFILQRGSNLNHFDAGRGIPRANTFQPMMEKKVSGIQGVLQNEEDTEKERQREQENKSKKNKFAERLLRSIKQKQKGCALFEDMSLDAREKQYIAIIQEQQLKIGTMTKELQKISDQIQIKKTQIKYSEERNKEVQEKLRYLEQIKEVYEKNMKIKDTVFAETNEEYANRFGKLMAELESLHSLEEKMGTQLKQTEEEHKTNSKKMQSEYEQKLSRLLAMMEAELIEFRNKELEYLEIIRQLKQAKSNQFYNSTLELGKSAFRMERSDGLESVREEKEEKESELQGENSYEGKTNNQNQDQAKGQEKQIESPSIRFKQVSKQSRQQIQELKLKIIDLQATLNAYKLENQNLNSEFKVITKQCKELLQKNITLNEEISHQKNLLQQFNQKVSLFLEKEIDRLKTQINPHQKQLKQEKCTKLIPIRDEELLRKLEGFVEQIKSLKNSKTNSSEELLEHQARWKQYLKIQIEEMVKTQQNLKASHSESNPNETHSTQQLLKLKQQIKQRYDKYNVLYRQYDKIKQSNRLITQEKLTLKNQNINMHKQNLKLTEQVTLLKQQLTQAEYESQKNNSTLSQNYIQISELLSKLQKQKENQIENKLQSQNRLAAENKDEFSETGNILKNVNTKLQLQLEKQNFSMEIFKRQYKQLWAKYQAMTQEHKLLLGVIGDLVQDVV